MPAIIAAGIVSLNAIEVSVDECLSQCRMLNKIDALASKYYSRFEALLLTVSRCSRCDVQHAHM